MTRDEAIKTVIEKSGRFLTSPDMAACLVDTWAAVGIIKLDEPKSVPRKVMEAITDIPLEFRLVGNIEEALDKAGLKIVEK